MFGATLADLPTAQSTLGEMATAIDAAALLTCRTAWRRDVQKLATTREAAMAKMTATENAQWVIDQARQLFAAGVFAPGRSPSGSIAKSGRCASTRVRRKFKNSSSAAS
jgi:alkylation response protein AidB-like acyl-CoA dehydrogenase